MSCCEVSAVRPRGSRRQRRSGVWTITGQIGPALEKVTTSFKTGTLTERSARVHSAVDAAGQPGEKILLYAYLNASFETGYVNPIDEAIRAYRPLDSSGYEKLDEIPYNFLRKRLRILFSVSGRWRAVMVPRGRWPA